MAKVGKLGKLKSAIKRWPSLTKFSRNNSNISSSDHQSGSNKVSSNNLVEEDHLLHAVYVGKARRRYLVSSEVVEHPLFQELVDKSGGGGGGGGGGGDDDGIAVACEVVLFEHLLWMLDNAEVQLGSMDELVDFYTC